MERFCSSSFWDYDLVWTTDHPEISTCFQKTVLSWIPCLYLCLFSPLETILILRSKNRNIPRSWLNVFKFIFSLSIIFLMAVQLGITTYVYESATAEDYFYPVVIAVTVALQTMMLLIEKRRGIQSSGVIFVLWLLMCICFMPGFSSHVMDLQIDGAAIEHMVFIVFYSLDVVMLFLNCFADKAPLYIENSRGEKPCPEANASFLSGLTFSWMDGLIWKGFRITLSKADLWNLSYRNSSKKIVKSWQKNVSKWKINNIFIASNNKKDVELQMAESLYTKDKSKGSVFPILRRTFGRQFLFGALLKLCTDILQFVSPQILSLLIGFIEDENAYAWQGYMYAIILLVNAQCQTFFLGQYFKTMFDLGMKIRSAVVSNVYRKALKISNSARKDSSVGEIVNLMSVDAQRFMDLMAYGNMIWSAPFQIILASFFLWKLLGVATLAGIGVLVILIPINAFIANRVKHLQANQMKQKDFRVKLMNEILNGIKVIKLYAWEIPFIGEILNARKKEIKYLKRSAYYNAGSSFVWSSSPFLVSIASFGVYSLINEKRIDAHLAFVSLALFNLLRFPISSLPNLISNVVQANISLKRMNKFLNADELDPNSVSRKGDSVHIRNGEFWWDIQGKQPTLRNINVEIQNGDLVGIVGSVGAGKSSLCSAFLGEISKTSGIVNVSGSVSYVAQQAWIQNNTLKNNILFGKEEDPTFYNKIIEACALNPDIETLPGGHEAEIGEKGINLSGGQKQRVSLGRAAYADTDIYILDDPLSAVDSHVGRHIFDEVIGPHGILQKKTRIYVTHGLTYLRYMDHIVVMKDGTISEQGSYEELIAKKGAFQAFILQYLVEKEEDTLEEVDLENLKLDMESSIGRSEFVSQISKRISTRYDQDKESLQMEDNGLNGSLKHRPIKRTESNTKKQTDTLSKPKNRITEEEKVEVGKVSMNVYGSYVKAAGVVTILVTSFGYTMYHVSGIGTNLWLAEWTKDTNGTSPTSYYLGVYGLFGFVQALSVLVGSIVCYYGTFTAGRVLHDKLLRKVSALPMFFFDTNPVGRILNRFSKDIDTMDTTMPYNVRWLISSFSEVTLTIAIIIYTTPFIIIVITPVMVIYIFILVLYVATSRQLKRIESVTRSPIYSNFGETIQGAVTIRAFGRTEEFILNSERHVDNNQECYYPFIMGNRWLAMRLETLANVVTFSAGLLAVMNKENISSSDVGISVSYALQMTQILNWFVRMCSDIETNLVSVERINQYLEMDSEADWTITHNKPPENWPQKGMVSFSKYATRYRKGLDLVVKGVDFEITPAEKIGIVGRTGAGKSSLTLGLFRIIEPAHGTIVIDGVDISKIGLHDLRSKITIIPQDPVLFSGTMRLNLDPFNAYTDEKLWNALEHAHLKVFVSGLSNGLQHEISEGGENLSVGQRQLVCLARALLRKTRVLILDEATAAVDMETDDLIQRTIRREFNECTVITIAHRLNTIMDANKVLVLDSGMVKEYDSPTNLLGDKTSAFYSMAEIADVL